MWLWPPIVVHNKYYSVVEAYSDADSANTVSLKSMSGNVLMMYGKYHVSNMCSRDPRDKQLLLETQLKLSLLR